MKLYLLYLYQIWLILLHIKPVLQIPSDIHQTLLHRLLTFRVEQY